jgi:ankyrin repeat protein
MNKKDPFLLRNFRMLFLAVPLSLGFLLFVLYGIGVLDSDIFKAIRKGNLELVEQILSRDRQKAIQYQGSLTPLHQAAYYNQVKIAKLLIQFGADVNAKGGRHNFTPIFIAASKGDVEFIKMLINNGAKINIQDDLGQTPLISAVMSDDSQAVRILIDNGANLEVRDKNNKSAIDYAIKKNNKNIIALLK